MCVCLCVCMCVCVCGKFNIKIIFKLGMTLSCGKVYIGETRRRLETQIKDHKDAYRKGELGKSAITEHPWNHHHPIRKENLVNDRDSKWRELLVKEGMHIQPKIGASIEM